MTLPGGMGWVPHSTTSHPPLPSLDVPARGQGCGEEAIIKQEIFEEGAIHLVDGWSQSLQHRGIPRLEN